MYDGLLLGSGVGFDGVIKVAHLHSCSGVFGHLFGFFGDGGGLTKNTLTNLLGSLGDLFQNTENRQNNYVLMLQIIEIG